MKFKECKDIILIWVTITAILSLLSLLCYNGEFNIFQTKVLVSFNLISWIILVVYIISINKGVNNE